MHELPLRERIRDGIRNGWFYSVAYSLLGGLLLVVRGPTVLADAGISLLAFFGLYLFGGLLGGALAGALEPYTRSMLGRMSLGAIIAFPIGLFGALAIRAPADSATVIWGTAALFALTAGPMGGFIFWRTR